MEPKASIKSFSVFFDIDTNNRKILNGFFNSLGIENSQDILRIVDKLEKIGEKEVKKELKEISIDDNAVDSIIEFMTIRGTTDEKISKLRAMNVENERFNTGVDEMEQIFEYISREH